MESVRVVLNAATVLPIYIPTVREEWIKAVNRKSPPASEDPEDPAKQPKKTVDTKTGKKPVAKKSSSRQQKVGSKKDDDKDKSQSQEEDLGEHPEGPIGQADPPHPSKKPEGPNLQKSILKGLWQRNKNLKNQESSQKVPNR